MNPFFNKRLAAENQPAQTPAAAGQQHAPLDASLRISAMLDNPQQLPALEWAEKAAHASGSLLDVRSGHLASRNRSALLSAVEDLGINVLQNASTPAMKQAGYLILGELFLARMTAATNPREEAAVFDKYSAQVNQGVQAGQSASGGVNYLALRTGVLEGIRLERQGDLAQAVEKLLSVAAEPLSRDPSWLAMSSFQQRETAFDRMLHISAQLPPEQRIALMDRSIKSVGDVVSRELAYLEKRVAIFESGALPSKAGAPAEEFGDGTRVGDHLDRISAGGRIGSQALIQSINLERTFEGVILAAHDASGHPDYTPHIARAERLFWEKDRLTPYEHILTGRQAILSDFASLIQNGTGAMPLLYTQYRENLRYDHPAFLKYAEALKGCIDRTGTREEIAAAAAVHEAVTPKR